MSQAVKAGLGTVVEVIQTIMEVIRERSEIPSGELYALLMPSGCTLAQYEKLEDIMIKSGKVEKKGQVLKWKK